MDTAAMTDREVTQKFVAMFAPPTEETEQPEQPQEEVGEGAVEEEAAQEVEQVEEGEQEEVESPALHTVRVDGKEVQVPYDELLAGYSRQADYTRKTQALAQERKSLEAEVGSVRQEREQYAAVLPQLRQVLEAATLGAEPDWDRLFAEDPVSAARQQYEWRKRKEQIEAIRQEEARVAGMRATEQQQQMAQTLQAERARLLERIPEWSDPKVAQKEQGELVEFGRTLGFSDQELAQVFDHRAVLALRMAMLYERAKAQGHTKAKESKVKTAAPGSKDVGLNSKSRELNRLRERAKSGKVHDVAPLMGALLSRSK